MINQSSSSLRKVDLLQFFAEATQKSTQSINLRPSPENSTKSQKTHATGRYLHARVCKFATMRRIASIPCLHFEASPRFQLVSPRNSKCTKNLQQRPFLFTTRQSPTSTRMQVAGRPNAYMENSSALSLLASPVGQEFWWAKFRRFFVNLNDLVPAVGQVQNRGALWQLIFRFFFFLPDVDAPWCTSTTHGKAERVELAA